MLHLDILWLTFLSLFPIVNPIGFSPAFLSLTEHLTSDERHRLAYRVAIYSVILLLSVLFFGKYILGFFGLTLPFIRIAGGLVVAFTAWQMLNARPKLSKLEKKEYKDSEDVAFFPLTLPLTAGAGAIAITVAIAINIQPVSEGNAILQYAFASIGIILIGITVAICYRFSDIIFHRIGRTGANVITRIFAFLLLAISISVIWQGLLPLIILAKQAN